VTHFIKIFFTVGFLSACGGGSSSTSPTPSPTSPTLGALDPLLETQNVTFYTQKELYTQQPVSLIAAASSGTKLVESSWQQLSGPSVVSQTAHTQVLSFETQVAGQYQFEYSAKNILGQNIAEQLTIEINTSSTPIAHIRLDHAAVETGKVSLRADAMEGATVTNVSWSQVAGPTVTNLTEQSPFIFFEAPAVNQDTVIAFEATLTYQNGTSGKDTSHILVLDTEINSDGYFPRFSDQIVSTDVKPYRSDSPYANSLNTCIYNNTVDSSCTFSALSLIGQQTSTPTIDDILARLLVSHPWMGDRFKQYLEQSVAAPDMLKLLRATTAIVISYDIRPSFYWTATGAIYLDANNFWMTPEERDTLNDQPDFRSGFSNELQFRIPWRYVKDNRSYLSSSQYPISERLERQFADLEASVTWLMYHELGHANDFFPPASWDEISNNFSPLRYFDENPPNSSQFSLSFPLNSVDMKALAQVSFAGDDATNLQKTMQPSDVALLFEPDNAAAYYSYSTIREDYATLFERFMMAYRMGVSADVAVTNDDSDLIVTWGQRDRISEWNVRPRVTEVVEQILPELDVESLQSKLPDPELMQAGSSWFDTLDLSSQGLKKAAKGQRNSDHDDTWLKFQHHYPETPPVKK
jgi:hypothetical protein